MGQPRRFLGWEIKVKIKVKGSGQGRPLHTGKGKSNVNVKGTRCGRRSVPPLRTERARMGHPRRFLGWEVKIQIKIKINVKGSGQSLP
jgi:hypothetical protein